MRLESVSYAAMVGKLRQVVLKFSTSGALKLSQLILANQLDLIVYDVVAFQLENGPLIWIQNRSQIARYLTATNKGKIVILFTACRTTQPPINIHYSKGRKLETQADTYLLFFINKAFSCHEWKLPDVIFGFNGIPDLKPQMCLYIRRLLHT